MAAKKVCQNGDFAIGHVDINGVSIVGVISSDSKMLVGGVKASKSGDIVSFPSHPHALDSYGNPTNYRSHSVAVEGTGKLIVEGRKAILDGTTVNVADEAGGNAELVSTQYKLLSN